MCVPERLKSLRQPAWRLDLPKRLQATAIPLTAAGKADSQQLLKTAREWKRHSDQVLQQLTEI